jgi:3-hydroxyacyl-CoA dehydrogenase
VIGLLQAAGKKTVVLRREVPGFIVNRLQVALVREAVSLVRQGIASYEDIDAAVRNSIAPRMSAGGVRASQCARRDYLSVRKTSHRIHHVS